MAVTQLGDGTMCNGSSGPWTGLHCLVEPCRSLYGGGGPCSSLNCVIAQWLMVHLDYGQESIVWLDRAGHCMVEVDHVGHSIV
jgi:hypothetical protein